MTLSLKSKNIMEVIRISSTKTRMEHQSALLRYYRQFDNSNTSSCVCEAESKTSYTPDLFKPYMALVDAVLNQKDMDLRARELAILAVMAVYDTPFVLYAHTRIAMKIGLSEEQCSLARQGTTPPGLSEDETVVYTTALELARSRGPLDEQTWQKAEKVLGREKAARLAHVVGVYLYSSTLLNLGAIPSPEN